MRPILKTRALTVLLILVSIVMTQVQANNDQQSWAETCTPWDEWDKPAPPYKVHANTYYVGTCGISAILITGNEGYVLIDGGTESGARVVVNNIRSLGFDIHDIKILLNSHEHFDHVAGLAHLKAQSGARLYASERAKAVLTSGIVSSDDPQSGMHDPFPSVEVDELVEEGKSIVLGELSLTPLSTPGHSPGALSWYWASCESDECLNVVYADSLSPVSSKTYRFSDHTEYVDAYKAGLRRLSNLDCDLLLTPHPSASKMVERIKEGNLIGGMNCADYAASVLVRLQDRLEKEME